MDKKGEHLLRKAEQQMGTWAAAINEHNWYWHHAGKSVADEQKDQVHKAAAVLAEISEFFVRYCGAKDRFDNSRMYLNLHGPALIIKSEKLDMDFQLGIDDRSVFLTAYLHHIENLRFMGDDFYRQLLSLEALGELEVLEHERYSEEVTGQFGNIFAGGKSKLFRIMRCGIVATSGKVKDAILPHLEIYWPYEKGIEEAVENGCKAFKTLYKLNYELWKVSDLKKKGNW